MSFFVKIDRCFACRKTLDGMQWLQAYPRHHAPFKLCRPCYNTYYVNSKPAAFYDPRKKVPK